MSNYSKINSFSMKWVYYVTYQAIRFRFIYPFQSTRSIIKINIMNYYVGKIGCYYCLLKRKYTVNNIFFMKLQCKITYTITLIPTLFIYFCNSSCYDIIIVHPISLKPCICIYLLYIVVYNNICYIFNYLDLKTLDLFL